MSDANMNAAILAAAGAYLGPRGAAAIIERWLSAKKP